MLFRNLFRGATHAPKTLSLAPGIRVRIHDDGAVFLQPDRGVVYSCNSIGAKIWTGLREKRAVEEIAADLAREYTVSAEVTNRDAGRFVDELERAGILVRGRA